jgi:flagellar hook assembly protein FlgD
VKLSHEGSEILFRFVSCAGDFIHSASTNRRHAVYDTKGRLIQMLVDGFQTAGMHKSNWDGRDRRGMRAASGIYLYRLKVGTSFAITHKMMLLQ